MTWEQQLDTGATVKILTFKVATGVLFALAILSFIGRAILRLHSRQPLTLDDYPVFFGCLSLIAGTGVLYANITNMYLLQAVVINPKILVMTDTAVLAKAIDESNMYAGIANCLLWTAIFAVKLSFLIFFWQLVRPIDGLKIYYWTVVAVTTLAWPFAASNSFVSCPHVGRDTIKCSSIYSPTNRAVLSILPVTIDILTDLLLISIPILVLHSSKMRTRQKVAVGSFLCLSLIMIAIAGIRMKKVFGATSTNGVYKKFWLHIEASVALLMASLTAYRTFFNIQKGRKLHRKRMMNPLDSFRGARVFGNREGGGKARLPEIPGGTMTGLDTFMGKGKYRSVDGAAGELGRGTRDEEAGSKLGKPEQVFLGRMEFELDHMKGSNFITKPTGYSR